MRTLSQIELYFETTPRSDEEKIFLVKSRCICNFLERHLASLKFETERSRINIYCSRTQNEVLVEPMKNEQYILGVCLPYQIPPINGLSTIELQKHYATIIKQGLSAASQYMPVPCEFCAETLESFQQGGCVNRWVQADKTWAKHSLRSTVVAELTTDAFTAKQEIRLNNERIAEQQIAEAKTRESLFYPYLGKLYLQRGTTNIVYKTNKRIISTFDYAQRKFIKV